MSEIGGEFHLPASVLFRERLNHLNRLTPDGAACFLTASGRDSLKLIVKILNLTRGDEVLLPSYLCKEMLIPLKEERVEYSFYRVDERLTADIDDIESRLRRNTKALLVIHYFGYRQPIEEIRKRFGANPTRPALIEDAAQSFLTKHEGLFCGAGADFAFSSFRKFLPVLDGSLLLTNTERAVGQVNWGRSSLSRLCYLWLRYLGMSSKSLYLKTHLVPKPLFLRTFASADKMLNRYPKPAKMSSLSRRILNRLDLDDIIMKRRRNFQHLLENWRFDALQPLFRELPPDVCPLGFPVLTASRDLVKRELIERGVFPPVHWPLPPEIDKREFEVSWEISRHILTIPVDQRYGLTDMGYILDQLRDIDALVPKTPRWSEAEPR